MELDWKLQQQRWEALHSAMLNCPKFRTEGAELLQSVVDLTSWVEAAVEPWLSAEISGPLGRKREEVERWVTETFKTVRANPEVEVDVPTEKINALRAAALSEISAALMRMRRRYSTITKNSKL